MLNVSPSVWRLFVCLSLQVDIDEDTEYEEEEELPEGEDGRSRRNNLRYSNDLVVWRESEADNQSDTDSYQ